VSVAATFYGWNTPTKTVVAIVGQVIGGTLAFPVAAELLPAYVQMGGPTLGGLDVQEGMMWECGLTFLLMLLILVAATQFGLPAQRPIIAAGIRALIYYGGKTGPAMNPMIAFAWVSRATSAPSGRQGEDRSNLLPLSLRRRTLLPPAR
jgi:glycerol uptake facilitator-like aquaporin